MPPKPPIVPPPPMEAIRCRVLKPEVRGVELSMVRAKHKRLPCMYPLTVIAHWDRGNGRFFTPLLGGRSEVNG